MASAKQVSGQPTGTFSQRKCCQHLSGKPAGLHEDLFCFVLMLPRISEAAAVFSDGSILLSLGETVCGSSDFGVNLLAAVTCIC